jgi:very-short-patch-repair endonuclease
MSSKEFIIDFAFMQKRLLIEVDGGYHGDENKRNTMMPEQNI